MKKIYSLMFALVFGTLGAYAQYCVPTITNNCTPDAPEKILNVTFVEIDNTTGCDPGVNDFTDMVATVAPGGTYEISVDIEADSGFPDDYVLLYIDWNQNQVLNDPVEFYHIAGPTGASGTYTADVTVPNDALMGETRMRIVVNWSRPDYDGCAVRHYGEIEDYTVNVEVVGMIDNTIAGFSYFPNPGSDILNLKAAVSLDDVSIFNINGQQVFSQSIGAQTGELNLKQLEAGVYLMKVSSGGVTATSQLVKK